jgi:hypothetical protein
MLRTDAPHIDTTLKHAEELDLFHVRQMLTVEKVFVVKMDVD